MFLFKEQASIEISYKIKAFGHAYLVHYSIFFHSLGGYFNSLILQALELLPGRAELATYPSIVAYALLRVHFTLIVSTFFTQDPEGTGTDTERFLQQP